MYIFTSIKANLRVTCNVIRCTPYKLPDDPLSLPYNGLVKLSDNGFNTRVLAIQGCKEINFASRCYGQCTTCQESVGQFLALVHR